MNNAGITLDIALLFAAMAVVAFLIYRLVRKGISQKYDRSPTAKVHTSSWSALSAGIDPTEKSNEKAQ